MVFCPETRKAIQRSLAANAVRVCLEGNIGAGKSTVTAALAKRGYAVAAEPVEAWTLLPRFYAEPHAYAFALQVQILTSCVALGDARSSLITERGAEASLQVFGESLVASGHMTPAQLRLLHELHGALALTPCTIILFLDVSTSICLARIAERGRACEAGITQNYLDNLQGTYEQFLRASAARGIHVQRVPCENASAEASADRVELALAQALGLAA